ncbi:MAG: hypothetical protein QNJ17_16380 [Desulfocapsaceae bacterium]|nr:hypothetical protein [Desulfocapsaceae bacterium]
MTYTDQNGEPAGLLMESAIKTIEKAGFDWEAVSLPANRIGSLMATGHIHVWLGLDTLPQFKGNTHVGVAVVEKLTLGAYTIGYKPPINKLQDLNGKTLLILRGYSYGGWTSYIKDPANNIRYLEFNTHEKAFERLKILSERIDNLYLLNYKHPSDIVLQKLALPDLQFNQISSFDMHFVVTKKMAEAKIILERIETAFQQLSESGE